MARRGRPPYPDILTPREWDVLALLREELSNEQIGQRLGITERTAKYHVAEILGKLGVESRQAAASWDPERRPWWMTAVSPLLGWRKASLGWLSGATGVAVVVLMIGGLGLMAVAACATAVSCGGGSTAEPTETPATALAARGPEPTATPRRTSTPRTTSRPEATSPPAPTSRPEATSPAATSTPRPVFTPEATAGPEATPTPLPTNTVAPAATGVAGVVITLQRTPCLGFCPVYSLEILGDGSVTYEGSYFVAVEGTRTASIPAGQVRLLVERFNEIGYFQFEDAYLCLLPDIASYATSFTDGAREKGIVRCGNQGPQALEELEDFIDTIVDSQHWVGELQTVPPAWGAVTPPERRLAEAQLPLHASAVTPPMRHLTDEQLPLLLLARTKVMACASPRSRLDLDQV